MTVYTVTDEQLTSIANAIRRRAGTTEDIAFPGGFVNSILYKIPEASWYGLETVDLTLTETKSSNVTIAAYRTGTVQYITNADVPGDMIIINDKPLCYIDYQNISPEPPSGLAIYIPEAYIQDNKLHVRDRMENFSDDPVTVIHAGDVVSLKLTYLRAVDTTSFDHT